MKKSIPNLPASSKLMPPKGMKKDAAKKVVKAVKAAVKPMKKK